MWHDGSVSVVVWVEREEKILISPISWGVCVCVFTRWPCEGQRRWSGDREPCPGSSAAAGSCGGTWSGPCWTPWCHWDPPRSRKSEIPASNNLGDGEGGSNPETAPEKGGGGAGQTTYRRSAGSAAARPSLEPRCTGESSGLRPPAGSTPGPWYWYQRWRKKSCQQVMDIHLHLCSGVTIKNSVAHLQCKTSIFVRTQIDINPQTDIKVESTNQNVPTLLVRCKLPTQWSCPGSSVRRWWRHCREDMLQSHWARDNVLSSKEVALVARADRHTRVTEDESGATGSTIDENERVPGPCECDPTECVRDGWREKQQCDQRTESMGSEWLWSITTLHPKHDGVGIVNWIYKVWPLSWRGGVLTNLVEGSEVSSRGLWKSCYCSTGKSVVPKWWTGLRGAGSRSHRSHH